MKALEMLINVFEIVLNKLENKSKDNRDRYK